LLRFTLSASADEGPEASACALAGRDEVGGMRVIDCRGTGTWGPRMRLWPPGEVLRVTLRAGR
jgi:hypothetical protein